MTYPIPKDALDDRLGFIGTSGSGKTYNAGSAAERILKSRARVVVVDPLGVWWGLRLLADGKTASPFNVAIFGGPHGDLPLTENAGALIGETAATMAESCIVDLSELGSKSADRRFMTAFLDTIYRKAPGEPFHLIVDEADLFAPQKPPKGDETLLNLMEQIVRRGRIKGFIPWLISQRPAVLNKNVLSQVDGLIAFKLTASQDRDALDGWIEGQADKAQGKAIKDALPAMQIGSGVVWVPGRGVLQTATFPLKETFDSSRTPKRGEKKQKTAALKPLDLGALKERLSTVEAETKSNDPRALKAEIAKLKAEAAKSPKPSLTVEKSNTDHLERSRSDAATIKELRKALEIAMKFVVEINASNFFKAGGDTIDKSALEKVIADATDRATKLIEAKLDGRNKELSALQREGEKLAVRLGALLEQDVSVKVDVRHNEPFEISQRAPMVAPVRRTDAPRTNGSTDGLAHPQRRVLNAVGFWKAIGHDAPTREQIAAVAGYSPSSGGFNNLIGGLKTNGYLEIPQPGRVALSATAPFEDMTPDEARAKMRGVLTNPQIRLLDAALETEEVSREDLGAKTEYSPNSGGFNNLIGSLSTLGIFLKPAPGYVAVSPWAREVLS